MPILSIIIPVYKAERFIEKCLLSLLNQTFQDMEVIVVDDCGPDNSMQVVERVKGDHPRGGIIRVVKMPHNSGAAAARNQGLEVAQGTYVGFVDSDDWCEPTMYEQLVQAAAKDHCDWCYSKAIKDYQNGKTCLLEQPFVEPGLLDAPKRRFMLTHFVAYFTTAVYDRQFLMRHHMVFPPFKFSEDSFFTWLVVMNARRFAVVDAAFYHYVIHPQSVTSRYDPQKASQKTEVFRTLLLRLAAAGQYQAYKPELDYLFLKKGFFIPLVLEGIGPQRLAKETVRARFASLQEQIPDYQKNPYLRRDKKLALMLQTARTCPRLFAGIMKEYARGRREAF